MTRHAQLPRAEEAPASIAPPSTPEQMRSVKARIIELSQRIAALSQGQVGLIKDVAAAQEMAQTVKPYVDRLVALQRLLNPVDRIIDKREQIEELQAGIAQDVAEVEQGLSGEVASAVETSLLTDLEGEIAAVKRDRKLFISDADAEDDEPAAPAPDGRPGPRGLLDLPVAERLRRILGRRFVSLADLEEILGAALGARAADAAGQRLERTWRALFDTPEFRPHVERNRVKALQKAFADYALLPRVAHLDEGEREPCTLASLRDRFGTFFLTSAERSLWYTRLDFYRAGMEASQWALVDRQYLNCTFKKPSIRLLMYARANALPAGMVRQKSVLEDVYDRIIVQLALREKFFDHCNSMTRTTYQQGSSEPVRQVYVYYKEDCVRISGKKGTPHWRPTRPRWPGVLPSIAPQ